VLKEKQSQTRVDNPSGSNTSTEYASDRPYVTSSGCLVPGLSVLRTEDEETLKLGYQRS
jgi:hypothetical protein